MPCRTNRAPRCGAGSQHRGAAESGGGNHRGSIFRLIVGAALKNRDGLGEPRSWGVGSDLTAAARRLGVGAERLKREEEQLERAVSEYIGQLPFLYVAVEDEPGDASLRGVIERNTIGLLSNFQRDPLDRASEQWLGRYSDRPRVQASGLWNNNHVDEGYTPDFLDALDKLVER